jgi:hypothetical protein
MLEVNTMFLNFIIIWLLCAVAFAIANVPPDVMTVIKVIVAGVLIAIAICFVPGAHLVG